MTKAQRPWHALAREETLQVLGTTERGLTAREARFRLAKIGPNELVRRKRVGAGTILARQFHGALNLFLLIAGAVSFVLGEVTDATVIVVTAAVTIGFGFFQEWKSERALAALHSRIEMTARTLRDSKLAVVPARDLVPGDIVHLSEGDRVPADLRVISVRELEADESTLTGESLPQEKSTQPAEARAALVNRTSLLFLGTVIVRGAGVGVVVATGGATELGRIALSLARIKEPATPLQQATSRLVLGITVLVGAGLVITLTAGLVRGLPLLTVLITAVAVAVAAIPEGLTVSVTIMLTRGMLVLLKSRALVRRLLAAETLGAVSVVCLDKTGTITRGDMRLVEVRGLPGADIRGLALELVAASVTGARPTDAGAPVSRWQVSGEATERALLSAAAAAGQAELYRKRLVADSAPFSSERGFYATIAVRRQGGRARFIAVGAPEKIFKASTMVIGRQGVMPLGARGRAELETALSDLSGSGYRTVAIGFRDLDGSRTITAAERRRLPELTFVALLALADPIRPEVPAFIRRLRQAGIRPVIITGDNPRTAAAVARAIGFARPEAASTDNLERRSPAELAETFREFDVFARVTPSYKLRLIEAFQEAGNVVAMTGDGVNDAPALKRADIGVVMGAGTDVAKEVADLVLLDNKLSTMIRAVIEGRGIFENIRKVAVFLFYDSFAEVVLISTGLLLHLPLPLLAAQILWVNMIEDVGPSFAMAFEPTEARLMSEAPRRRGEPLLPPRILAFTVAAGAATSALLIALFLILWRQTGAIDYVRTMTFVGLGIHSLFTVFALRRLRESVLEMPLLGNRPMLLAVVVGAALFLVGIYVPPVARLLGAVSLGGRDWLILIAFGIFNLAVIEVLKAALLRRTGSKS